MTLGIVSPHPINPVLFLDIEGVLCTRNFMRQKAHEIRGHGDWGRLLDPEKVCLLSEIVSKHNLVTVISSSWKHAFSVSWIRDRFREHGFSGYIADTTPTDSGDNRGAEINRWLVRNRPDPVTRNYVVMDDADVPAHRGHLVLVDPTTGLEGHHATEVARILALRSEEVE